MRPVSSEFLAAVRESHQVAIAANLIDTSGNVTALPVVDGTVTLDQRAAVRGRLDLTVQAIDDQGTSLVPDSPAALLAPYGNEIQILRGIRYPNGFIEYVAIGVFRIEESTVEDTPTGAAIRVTGLDRSSIVGSARFEEPFQIDPGTNYITALTDTLAEGYPSIQTGFPTTSSTTPLLIAQEGDDRWAFAQDMAQALGADLYFDGDGDCVLVPSASLSSGSPVSQLVEGAGGVLLSAGRSWVRGSAFNRVIATGENLGETAPARGVATDDNPLSPTYYYGGFGRTPRFFSSSFLTTDAQAADAAAAILARELGTTQQVSFGAIVNPALEPGDVVRITRARSGIDEDHVIDTINIPLSVTGTLTGSTRAVQVTS